MQERQVQSLGGEDPLEEGMATHSSILAWRIPWTEEPGGLQSMGSQRVGHDRVTHAFLHLWKGQHVILACSLTSSSCLTLHGILYPRVSCWGTACSLWHCWTQSVSAEQSPAPAATVVGRWVWAAPRGQSAFSTWQWPALSPTPPPWPGELVSHGGGGGVLILNLFLIEGSSLYRIVLVSAKHQHESVIGYVPSLLKLPPHPTPLGCYADLVWVPQVIQQTPVGCLCYICHCGFIPVWDTPGEALCARLLPFSQRRNERRERSGRGFCGELGREETEEMG